MRIGEGYTKVQLTDRAFTTIPLGIMTKLDIEAGDVLRWSVDGNTIIITLQNRPLLSQLRFG